MLQRFIIFFLLYSIRIGGNEFVSTAPDDDDQELTESVTAMIDKMKKAIEQASDEELETFLKQLESIIKELEKVKMIVPEKAKLQLPSLEKLQDTFVASEKAEDKGKCVEYKYAFFCCPPKGKGKCIPYDPVQSQKNRNCEDGNGRGMQQSPMFIPPWYPPLLPIYPPTPCPTPSCCSDRKGPLPITVLNAYQRSHPPVPTFRDYAI